MGCCTRASFERGLSCVPRFWHLKSDAGLTDIRLPALGGYIREVALLASVVAVCLQIRLLRVFIFCDFAHCSWLLYLLAK